MTPKTGSPEIGLPVSWGGRLLFPVVRRTVLTWAGGGILAGTPLALLIEEEGAWSFVPLEDGIGQEVLADLPSFPRRDEPEPGRHSTRRLRKISSLMEDLCESGLNRRDQS